MMTFPALGGIMVAIIRSSVDLPAPSDPTSPKIVPSSIASVTS